MNIIKVKNDTRQDGMGEGEVNTGGNGDGGYGYGSGICAGYGNDGLNGNGTGWGRGDKEIPLGIYKIHISKTKFSTNSGAEITKKERKK